MAITISQRELRNDSGDILRRAENGELFTVTRRGVPIADLGPHRADPAERPRFVAVADIAAGLGPLPDWDAAGFARDRDELADRLDDTEVDRWGRP